MMEDTTKKKKKFSFLKSLGFSDKAKAPSTTEKKTVFAVGNVENAIRNRKKQLDSID